MRRIFREIYPVMLTPFHSDGSVDFDGIQQLTDFYLETGATGLFANCLSSEMFLLTDEERIQITKTVVNQVKGRKPVVATGTFSLYQKKTWILLKKFMKQV